MVRLKKLREVAEVILGLLAVCYATGVLVLSAHHNHLGLQDADLELFKLRNILTGGMFWLTPIFALIPIAAYRYVVKEVTYRSGRITTALLAYSFLLSFYLFLCFVPLQAIMDHLFHIVVGLFFSLAAAIASHLLDEYYPKYHHKWVSLSIALLIGSAILLGKVLLPAASNFWKVASHLPFWVVFCSWIFITGTLFTARHLVNTLPQNKEAHTWVWMVVGLTVFCLYLGGVYAFTYGVYPFIPSARGGGNLSESRSAILIFTAESASSGIPLALLSSDQPQLPANCAPSAAAQSPQHNEGSLDPQSKSAQKQPPKPVMVFCSKPLKIVDQTAETIYVTILNPSVDVALLGRSGMPKEAIYGIPRKHVALLVFQPA
jgi:multisubunit Na+/H+ antiporter MnhG subunit